MAHNLFGKVNGFRFMYRKQGGAPWHNLGTSFESGSIDLFQAGEQTDLYYQVETHNLFSEIGGKIYQVPDQFGLWRPPVNGDNEWHLFSVVSDQYEVIQNQDLFETFNPISKTWGVETVGALGKGETVFFTLDAGSVDINGDEVHQYFLVTDNKDKKQATQILFTPIRVVCQNTLITGISSAKMNVSIRHKRGNNKQLIDIASTMNNMIHMVETTNNMFKEMPKIRFNLEDFKQMVQDILYPIPTLPEGTNVTDDFLKLKAKQEEAQGMLVEIYRDYSDKLHQTTAWTGYQAVTEYETHRPGRGVSQYKDVLFGKRADNMAASFSYMMKKA